MYNYHADLYTKHLSPEALETFRKGGYYTQLHKPGFRIVTLNTNFCYTFNFWVVYQPQDFEGHLQWFSDTMYAAERAGEKVWIVGHVPPGGSDCWNVWSIQFLRVINRYQNIILAQFYGHTHNDEFKVFFDSLNGGKPSGSLWIGASVTPYTELNPGYKVFYADGVRENATWQILDHETWIYDLATANEAGADVQPEFYKEYSAREAYGMEGFRPQDLWDFVQRMAVDDELFKLYYRHWFKNSGYDLDDEDCPSSGDISECKFDFLCSIVSTDYTSKHCDMLKALAKNA
jgi:sphingomyelin phosphodiesterase